MKQTINLKEVFSELFIQEKEEMPGDEEIVLLDNGEELTPDDEITLKDLEISTEDAIANSIEDDELDFLEEGLSAKGFKYEKILIAAIRKAGISGNIKKGAGANAAAADADFMINNVVYKVEAKLDANAQMGGGSVRFGKGEKTVVVKKKDSTMDAETERRLIKAVLSKSNELKIMIEFIAKKPPAIVNKKASKFPMSCTKDAWEAAKNRKLLVSTKIRMTADFIINHYASKGIHYIQIGGAGLFYMDENPAKLPIPKLDGEINVEIRTGAAGAKTLSNGIKVVGGGIRAQARLKTKNNSPYTLDDPASIQKMLKATKAKPIK